MKCSKAGLKLSTVIQLVHRKLGKYPRKCKRAQGVHCPITNPCIFMYPWSLSTGVLSLIVQLLNCYGDIKVLNVEGGLA